MCVSLFRSKSFCLYAFQFDSGSQQVPILPHDTVTVLCDVMEAFIGVSDIQYQSIGALRNLAMDDERELHLSCLIGLVHVFLCMGRPYGLLVLLNLARNISL